MKIISQRSILILLLISGCGFNGTQRLELTGGTKNDFNVNFTFIDQLIKLCKDSLLVENYTSIGLYNQAVANCVLNSAKALNPSSLAICQSNADLSGFTPDQLVAIHTLCGG